MHELNKAPPTRTIAVEDILKVLPPTVKDDINIGEEKRKSFWMGFVCSLCISIVFYIGFMIGLTHF